MPSPCDGRRRKDKRARSAAQRSRPVQHLRDSVRATTRERGERESEQDAEMGASFEMGTGGVGSFKLSLNNFVRECAVAHDSCTFVHDFCKLIENFWENHHYSRLRYLSFSITLLWQRAILE